MVERVKVDQAGVSRVQVRTSKVWLLMQQADDARKRTRDTVKPLVQSLTQQRWGHLLIPLPSSGVILPVLACSLYALFQAMRSGGFSCCRAAASALEFALVRQVTSGGS